jgi:hypothetical protein
MIRGDRPMLALGGLRRPAYAARNSHWAAFIKRGVGRPGCIKALGDCGDNVNWTHCVKRSLRGRGSRAATRTSPAASASAPIPDTTNTAAKHQRADRSQGGTVDGAQINRPARPAAWAEHIEPRRSGDQRRPNGGRPQHVAAGGEASVPAIDDELCLKARRAVRLQLGGTGFDVEPSCPDAHGASITGPVSEVDPAGRPRLDTAR